MTTVLELLRAQWDRAVGSTLVVLGAIAIVLGWVGVSGAVYPAEQLPYVISGGLGGLFLLGAGATLWLSADLRDEWRHLDTLESDVEARLVERLHELVAQELGGNQIAPGGDRPEEELAGTRRRRRA